MRCFSLYWSVYRDKERKAVAAELKREINISCQVEHDDLLDCEARAGMFFSFWKCRVPQSALWRCEQKYKDSAYKRKREIEILESRQQQGKEMFCLLVETMWQFPSVQCICVCKHTLAHATMHLLMQTCTWSCKHALDHASMCVRSERAASTTYSKDISHLFNASQKTWV